MFWAFLEVAVLGVCWLVVIGILFLRHALRQPD